MSAQEYPLPRTRSEEKETLTSTKDAFETFNPIMPDKITHEHSEQGIFSICSLAL